MIWIMIGAVITALALAAVTLATFESGRDILQWCYRKAMAAGFGAVLIVVLVGIEIWLIKSFLAVDATFIRPLAPPGIDPQVLQDISWALRAFGVIVGMALVYFHTQGMTKWFSTFRWLAGFCAALLFCHAMGLAFKSMDDQYKSNAVIADVADDQGAGVQVRVDAIDQQIAGIRSDRDAANQLLQGSIDSITNDGIDNDDEARVFAEQQQTNTNEAKVKIDELEAEKRTLLSEAADIQVTETKESATNDGVADLFTGLARIFTWSFDPEVEPSVILAFAIGIIFWILWYGFGEALMILIPPAGFAIVLNHAANEKDPTRVEAGKKAAETRNRRKRQILKIQEQADSYLPAWRKAVQYARNTKWTAKGISDTAFPNVSIDHVIEVLRKANKKGDWLPELEEEINLVKRLSEPEPVDESKKYAVDIIDPEPKLNGSEQPTEGDEGNVDNYA